MAEKIIKLILVLILLLAGLLYWLLPKTRLAKYFKMNETFFVLSNAIVIICSVIGLAVTFIWPQWIVELHLWELIVMPFALIIFYWMMVDKTLKSGQASYDEKQSYNMTSAAALTWAFSIPLMAFMFILYQNELVNGIIWFPYYLFITLLVFSASTLFYFKKA